MSLIFITAISVFLLFVAIAAFVYGYKAKKKTKHVLVDLNNYSCIIDQANDTMLVIDIGNGKILQANPSAALLLGYSEQELSHKSLFDLHPKEFLDKSSMAVADVWEKGGLIYDDIPFLTKSGEAIPVECSAKVTPFAQRPAIVIYARDIRERLKLQNQIAIQRQLIDEKSKDMQASIEYALRIQRSFLIEKEQIKTFAPESFIFFEPRDVVSGDFYWFINYELKADVQSETGNIFKAGHRILVVAAVDCTGHGVPGAFMSIIGNSLLDQTVRNYEIRSPAKALDYVNNGLKKILNRNLEDAPLRDGMDIALCSIDMDGYLLEYAGANNPLYVVRNNEIIILKADKQPITASPDAGSRPFENKVLPLQKNDCVYIFTDGYADQFGGEKEKKFLYRRFKELLLSIHHESMEEQKRILSNTFRAWKGPLSQVDDVLVIGVKIL